VSPVVAESSTENPMTGQALAMRIFVIRGSNDLISQANAVIEIFTRKNAEKPGKTVR
jgi:hypothetical protein